MQQKLNKAYDATVREFLESGNALVLISEDPHFKRVFLGILRGIIAVKSGGGGVAFAELQAGVKEVGRLIAAGKDVVVIMEKRVAGRSTAHTILTLKAVYPDLRVVALTDEISKEEIAYLYEVGVNNVIAKPASANNIIEKLTFTIRPQGKLSELVKMGKDMLFKKQHKAALAVAQKILEIKGGCPAALMLAGDVYMALGKRGRAMESYKAATASSHLYLEPLKKLAEAHRRHDEDVHLAYLKEIDSLSPLNSGRKVDIGAIYCDWEDFEEAERHFDVAMDIVMKEAGELVGATSERIAQTVQDTNPAMAEKYFKTAINAKKDNLTKKDLTLFNQRGIALKKLGKWEEAIQNYLDAIMIDNTDGGLFYNLALAHHTGKQMGQAVQALQNGIKKDPLFWKGNDIAIGNITNIFITANKPSLALAFLEEVLRVHPEHKKAASTVEKLKASPGIEIFESFEAAVKSKYRMAI